MILVCHAISQDHMTKGLSDMMGESPLWQVTSLPTFLAVSTVVVKI